MQNVKLRNTLKRYPHCFSEITICENYSIIEWHEKGALKHPGRNIGTTFEEYNGKAGCGPMRHEVIRAVEVVASSHFLIPFTPAFLLCREFGFIINKGEQV
jgi:hypothetical protein